MIVKDIDENTSESSKCLEKKTSLIYDLEDDKLSFSQSKPTEWKGNKRIHVPKSVSSSLESYFEVRRVEASRLYDECIAPWMMATRKGLRTSPTWKSKASSHFRNRSRTGRSSSASTISPASLPYLPLSSTLRLGTNTPARTQRSRRRRAGMPTYWGNQPLIPTNIFLVHMDDDHIPL